MTPATPPPAVVGTPATVPTPAPAAGGSSIPLPAIIGGAVGIVAVAAIIAAVVIIMKRRKAARAAEASTFVRTAPTAYVTAGPYSRKYGTYTKSGEYFSGDPAGRVGGFLQYTVAIVRLNAYPTSVDTRMLSTCRTPFPPFPSPSCRACVRT
jgi:hypothetical protein